MASSTVVFSTCLSFFAFQHCGLLPQVFFYDFQHCGLYYELPFMISSTVVFYYKFILWFPAVWSFLRVSFYDFQHLGPFCKFSFMISSPVVFTKSFLEGFVLDYIFCDLPYIFCCVCCCASWRMYAQLFMAKHLLSVLVLWRHHEVVILSRQETLYLGLWFQA